MKGTEELLLNNKELNLYQDFKQGKELLCLFIGDNTKHYNAQSISKQIDKLVKQYLIEAIENRKDFVKTNT